MCWQRRRSCKTRLHITDRKRKDKKTKKLKEQNENQRKGRREDGDKSSYFLALKKVGVSHGEILPIRRL